MSKAITKMGHVRVVDSTIGLGDTEYSLCNEFGLLKHSKSAMIECCDAINTHDTLVTQNLALKAALEYVLLMQTRGHIMLGSFTKMANKALEGVGDE